MVTSKSLTNKLKGFDEDYGKFKYYPILEFSEENCNHTIITEIYQIQGSDKGGVFKFDAQVSYGVIDLYVTGKVNERRDRVPVVILKKLLGFIPRNNSVKIFHRFEDLKILNDSLNDFENKLTKKLNPQAGNLRYLKEDWGFELCINKTKVREFGKVFRKLSYRKINKLPHRHDESDYNKIIKKAFYLTTE